MERIIAEISDLGWWISIVFVSIIINISSSYLKGALDNIFSKSSEWWKNNSVARKEAWEEKVNKLASNSKERDDAVTDEIRDRLKSIFLLLSSVIIFSCSLVVGLVLPAPLGSLLKIIFLVFSAFFSFLGFLVWKLAEHTEAELKEAKDSLSKQLIQEDVDA